MSQIRLSTRCTWNPEQWKVFCIGAGFLSSTVIDPESEVWIRRTAAVLKDWPVPQKSIVRTWRSAAVWFLSQFPFCRFDESCQSWNFLNALFLLYGFLLCFVCQIAEGKSRWVLSPDSYISRLEPDVDQALRSSLADSVLKLGTDHKKPIRPGWKAFLFFALVYTTAQIPVNLNIYILRSVKQNHCLHMHKGRMTRTRYCTICTVHVQICTFRVYFYYSSFCKGMPFIEQSYILFLSRRCCFVVAFWPFRLIMNPFSTHRGCICCSGYSLALF